MKVVALAGGVGGSKLAHGLAQVLAPGDLTVIVNTGDDFEHLGLHICPDLDTVCYTLGGLANADTGWGRAGESWNVLARIEELGGPTWFRLGDQDVATHLERTRRLRAGEPLSAVTRVFCEAWKIPQQILPMSDQAVRTVVETDQGELPFQEYFVHRRCEPAVRGFRFEGAQAALPAPGGLRAIEEADAVVICPSNPWVSIAPILAVAGVRGALQSKAVCAVSPIIGGQAVKGPAAKMYRELGMEPSALAVARHYEHLIGGFVLDRVDAQLEPAVRQLQVRTRITETLMKYAEDRRRLAEDVLDFVGNLP